MRGEREREREREREIGRDIGHGVDGDYLWSLPTYRSARSSTGEGQRAEGRGRAELWVSTFMVMTSQTL